MKEGLIGPFRQLLPLADLPLNGPIRDDELDILSEAGMWIQDGHIKKIGVFDRMRTQLPEDKILLLEEDYVGVPGLVDAHTHICYAGSRAKDYAMRVGGKTYLEIAREGGGIWSSVQQTRAASLEALKVGIGGRLHRHASEGVTTCEIKSGYGLTVASELNMLRAIQQVDAEQPIDVISTCLAAHIPPKDFDGDGGAYLDHLLAELLPVIQQEQLSRRIDIFIEEGAFNEEESSSYLLAAKQMGFSLTVHADQFHPGGSEVAVKVGAVSADHLEAVEEEEIKLLSRHPIVSVALPGASLGLGEPYAPVRRLLDAGACVAIASDWNPGSAPMGDLLLQAAVLGAAEHLSLAETFAAITYRAAAALELQDRGQLKEGMLADLLAFPCSDYRDIFYYQGKLKPAKVWKKGVLVS
ncbi:MAG: imidazolonepropionase [Bacteroidota bacterium]